ncbi:MULTISPECIES: hypothetical protein [unclassified Paenibacillus]|uniref:hypothetical protein n=1 Tax=unclassified Paenibacillus TaxID=185978 RepID=UPI001AE6DC75|nr:MULTISPECIES: hypothetical protein [unclassified Paenibacillus]MBP1154449.1 hypothetical protein [Paenibacillus sp. PvP091]MBP1170167.1 hypothetical protein [Paenibacillus sp. PvR098]MBP2441195.1 hypothetical protein [Paenibacillus sp. PvP052]
MNIQIVKSGMTYSKEDGYVGQVEFTCEGHQAPYEITFHSKKAKEWMYSLNFANESGPEKEILLLEEVLEEDDELFDQLVEEARSKLESKQS